MFLLLSEVSVRSFGIQIHVAYTDSQNKGGPVFNTSLWYQLAVVRKVCLEETVIHSKQNLSILQPKTTVIVTNTMYFLTQKSCHKTEVFHGLWLLNT